MIQPYVTPQSGVSSKTITFLLVDAYDRQQLIFFSGLQHVLVGRIHRPHRRQPMFPSQPLGCRFFLAAVLVRGCSSRRQKTTATVAAARATAGPTAGPTAGTVGVGPGRGRGQLLGNATRRVVVVAAIPYSMEANWDLEIGRLLGKEDITVAVCERKQELPGGGGSGGGGSRGKKIKHGGGRRKHVRIHLKEMFQCNIKRANRGKRYEIKRLPTNVLL